MKLIGFIGLICLGITDYSGPVTDDSNKADETSFELSYITAGLGSNMGQRMPTFKVHGLNYTYTSEQNSYYDSPSLEPIPISSGKLRQASVDSIIGIIESIEDTSIYNMSSAMSGVYQSMSVRTGSDHIAFRLHNSYHPAARQIMSILNSNLSTDVTPLWMSSSPPYGSERD